MFIIVIISTLVHMGNISYSLKLYYYKFAAKLLVHEHHYSQLVTNNNYMTVYISDKVCVAKHNTVACENKDKCSLQPVQYDATEMSIYINHPYICEVSVSYYS